jgi:hypothetical protein
MADVFVSCARIDKALVAPLVAALEAPGWSEWWDPADAEYLAESLRIAGLPE